jgi:hypothetical protein
MVGNIYTKVHGGNKRWILMIFNDEDFVCADTGNISMQQKK